MRVHIARTLMVICPVLIAGRAAAQGTVTKKEVEANTSIFFGNNSQRLVATRLGVSRADSAIELAVAGHYSYADAEIDTTRAVKTRSWDVSTNIDLHPFARVSPFVFGSVEASLEKQIDSRYGGGGGAKYTFGNARPAEEHDISLALLGEKTTPRTPVVGFDDNWLLRWSLRYRLNRKIDDRLTFSHTTLYKPKASAITDDYTISTVNTLGVAMNTTLALTFSFMDNYDSLARTRGAAENNDGQLLFGMKASW